MLAKPGLYAYTLAPMRAKIAPSILSAAFERLGADVQEVEAAGADQIHVDVMDGHFVPNLSMGPLVVEALKRVTKLPLDVHLMITDPERYAEAFIKAGASHISFHVETCSDPTRLANSLRSRGVTAGLALNPDTPVERIREFLGHFDMILVMTVNPGFGGQAFKSECLKKLEQIRQWEARAPVGRLLDVEVDGGIDLKTAPLARAAGANVFVAGNSIFKSSDPARALAALRDAVGANQQ